LCAISENGKCKLIIPQLNLITNKENEQIYYSRMADELIRYNRIKSFLFQPQFFLSFGNINYNLRDNEIIMVQSSLTQEYFDNLVPAVVNNYVKNNSYDEVEPIIKQTYENVLPADKTNKVSSNKNIDCKPVQNAKISSGLWSKCFPKKFKELEYSKFSYCTFVFMSDLIEKKTGERFSDNQIKNSLVQEYNKYLPNYLNKIIDILTIEGKKKPDNVSFHDFIYNDDYFLTTFDLWLLVKKYKIPTIFLSKTQGGLLETNEKHNLFLGYGFEGDSFAFIIIPGLRSENIPGFKIIVSDNNDIYISAESIIDNDCSDKIDLIIKNNKSIEDFLNLFTKKTKTKLIVEEEVDLDLNLNLNLENGKKPRKPRQKKAVIIKEDILPIVDDNPLKINKEKPKTVKNKNKLYVSRQQTKKNVPNLIIERDTPP
jgi:hypothetical protein